ncbi:MEKHLA domain-containing protein [Vibrio sp. S4M6]|uniref:MEKHLA domain-containing protein n=1 Tax=Vibrio sinus TaxID=2946865 RepID=UPI00202A3557|nr:MEKHLA domain-containing protein [Vibrio sinus]MCL9781660.1 MEKHLA domain-containing protein [Vibrio sinus]
MDNIQLDDPFYIRHGNIIAQNYFAITNDHLCPSTQKTIIEDMWEAPFAILSHGTQPDPIFNFANKTAQHLFEMDFATFTQTPSRYSAEPIQQEERDRLLARVANKGYIDDYCGVRISSSGKRFRVENALVFNLIDDQKRYYGQAAILRHWQFL